jgi:hypothetical protein
VADGAGNSANAIACFKHYRFNVRLTAQFQGGRKPGRPCTNNYCGLLFVAHGSLLTCAGCLAENGSLVHLLEGLKDREALVGRT